MKKILSVAVLIVTLTFSVCSAAEKSCPVDDMSIICKACLHFDDDSLRSIGWNPEEYKKTSFDELKKSFIQSSGINFSDEQIKTIHNSVIKLLKRAQFEIEKVSENGDKSTVKITVDTFEKFTGELVASKMPANVDAMSNTEKINALANATADALNDLEMVGKSVFTVECQYNEEFKIWLPVEAHDFDDVISSKVISFS